MIFTIFQRAVQSMVDGLDHNQPVGGSSPLGVTNLLANTLFYHAGMREYITQLQARH